MKPVLTNGFYKVSAMVLAAIFAVAVLFVFGPIASAHAADYQFMHRLYNPNSGEHFYTASIEERSNAQCEGWEYEGRGWCAPKMSSSPVYRLYSGTDHHYTTSAAERDHLISIGWSDEGIGWYSDDAQGVPLYRQFNPNVNPNAATNNSGSHNYTTGRGEHDSLVSIGWHDEGIGWYGADASSTDIGKVFPTTYDANRASLSSTKAFETALAYDYKKQRHQWFERWLVDRSLTSNYWSYGGDGSVVGGLVMLPLNERETVHGLVVWNGAVNYSSRTVDRDSARIKTLEVYADSEYVGTYSFAEDDFDARVLTFPNPANTDAIVIGVVEVYPGKNGFGEYPPDCCAREIAYF